MDKVNSGTDPCLTVRDIAQRLNVSQGFVYGQVARGRIEHYSLGGTSRKRGAIRFSECQFQEYLSSQMDKKKNVVVSLKKISPANSTPLPGTVSCALNRLLKQK